MNEFFLKIVNMSISTSWLILAVLVLRQVLKKAPKWANILLWGIVGARLLCPFSIESTLSLIPSAETIPANIETGTTPAIDSGIKAINSIINPMISQSNTPVDGTGANPLQAIIAICAIIWGLGAAVLLIYTAVSCLRLRRKVDSAVLYRDNIFQSENVNSPFVLGIIKPKIYLPFKVDGQNLEHVVSHEQVHIHRKDHWWKPLGFLLLAVHWFNPLMWLSYVLFCRDIELACDENVIKELGNEQRAAYAQALLACSVNRRMLAACPLAFGEIGVRQRVKSIMNYKKPAFWMIILSVTACVAAAVCFLTNPFDDPLHAPEPFCHTYRVEAIIYDAPQYSFTYTVDTAPQYTFSADYAFFEKTDTSEWVQHHGGFQDVRLSASTFDNYFKPIDNVSGWQNDSYNAKNIRRNTKRAWRLNVEGEDNNVFYYFILAKNGDVYLTYGYDIGGSNDAAEDDSLIRWLFKLERTDLLSCNAISNDRSSYIDLLYCPNGFGWNNDNLPTGTINEKGTLVFNVVQDIDTLVVSEDYYRNYGNSAHIEKETYHLERNREGKFELDVALRGDQIEEAIYFIQAETGVYVMKIAFLHTEP